MQDSSGFACKEVSTRKSAGRKGDIFAGVFTISLVFAI